MGRTEKNTDGFCSQRLQRYKYCTEIELNTINTQISIKKPKKKKRSQ